MLDLSLIQEMLELTNSEKTNNNNNISCLIFNNVAAKTESALDIGLIVAKTADIISHKNRDLAQLLYLKAGETITQLSPKTSFEIVIAGVCFEKAFNYNKAVHQYNKALKTDLTLAWQWICKGLIYRSQAKLFMSLGCYALSKLKYNNAAMCFGIGSEKIDRDIYMKWKLGGQEMFTKAQEANNLFEEHVCNFVLDFIHKPWSKCFQPKNKAFSNSCIYKNTDFDINNDINIVITGAVHGNEPSGTIACYELSRVIINSIKITIWPCVDSLGFYCSTLLNSDDVSKVNVPLPEGTKRFDYSPSLKTFIAEADYTAQPNWLEDIAHIVMENYLKYDASFLIWRRVIPISVDNEIICNNSKSGRLMEPYQIASFSTQKSINQRENHSLGGGRSFEIIPEGLTIPCASEANGPIGQAATEYLGTNRYTCWIDLHESRGDGFHVYLSPNALEYLALSHELIKYLSPFVKINKTIWNRKLIVEGIFELPSSAELWGMQKRIVLEVGEDLPLCKRTGLLSDAVMYILERFQF